MQLDNGKLEPSDSWKKEAMDASHYERLLNMESAWQNKNLSYMNQTEGIKHQGCQQYNR